MFLNIRIDLLILKTYYGQFTLTCHHIICISSLRLTLVPINRVSMARATRMCALRITATDLLPSDGVTWSLTSARCQRETWANVLRYRRIALAGLSVLWLNCSDLNSVGNKNRILGSQSHFVFFRYIDLYVCCIWFYYCFYAALGEINRWRWLLLLVTNGDIKYSRR